MKLVRQSNKLFINQHSFLISPSLLQFLIAAVLAVATAAPSSPAYPAAPAITIVQSSDVRNADGSSKWRYGALHCLLYARDSLRNNELYEK